MKSKEVKRQEAYERQSKHDNLSPRDRLAKLDRGKYRAFKERLKIWRNIVVVT